jgi:opacity protein-like surface antigen
MKHPFKALLVASALAAGLSTSALAADKVELSTTPQPVQQTIQQYLEGAQVTKVERTTKDNKVVFDVEAKRSDGKKITMRVGDDGKLLELKRD